MTWTKGQSGNPKGRNKSQWKAELEKAIKEYGEEVGETPFKRLAKLFYTSRDAAINMANFFIPKLRTVEAKIDGDSPFRLIIALPPAQGKENKQLPQTLQVVSKDITSDIEPKTQVSKDKTISNDNSGDGKGQNV